MTLDDLLRDSWACELFVVGARGTKLRRWKLVIAHPDYAPCFVGYGATVQAAVDDALRTVPQSAL